MATALSLLVAAAAASSIDGVAWRLEVFRLEAFGGLPGFGWIELIQSLSPGSDIPMHGVAETGNPFSGILNPFDSAADRQEGEDLFRAHCASCHGVDARGREKAPGLIGRPLDSGDSSWGTFRTIERGIAESAMPALPLANRERWQIIAYLQAQRGIAQATSLQMSSGVPTEVDVPWEAIVSAAAHPEDWLTYSGQLNGWRHSSLASIDRSNVEFLALAWARQFHTRDWVETSPIVTNGTMYVTEPPSDVLALDGSKGRVLWTRRFEIPEGLPTCCGRVNRGVALLNDRVCVRTLDGRLVALDARSGDVEWEVRVADPADGFTMTGAPLAVEGMIVVGVAGGEFGIRGFLDAYDAIAGRRRWRFETIPGPGQPGHESWGGESWRTGGGPTWVTGAYDPHLKLLCWGVGNPSHDFDGSVRPGDNLYANSVVALRAETGKLAWHFQFTPHDEHDYDANQTPMLVDVAENGKTKPLMLWANRNAFYYVIDRSSGAFQRARPFARQNWALRIDEETGRPVPNPAAAPTPEGALVWPMDSGATNWRPASYSPADDLVLVAYREQPSVFFSKGGDVEPTQPGAMRMGSATSFSNCTAQWGVRAIEPTTGRVVWDNELPSAGRRTGIGGVLTTAGGLAFVGAGETFYSLDSSTGRELWQVRLGGGINAAPISYESGGTQYVTIAAGSSLFSFAVLADDRNAEPFTSQDSRIE